MISSPDLLPFAGPEGFGENAVEGDPGGLPEALSVPLFSSRQPWSSRASFHTDFVLVAEFSEQVGPTPVMTIPDDPRVIGSFDLNHFSVRIMSVDYQASGPGYAPHTSAGLRLNFSEDSKVVLGDSAEDAFAYVQHVTLYDLEARGMVRPFCMAYVCSEEAKLMENFTRLSTGFSRASDSLKTGNRQAFSLELQRKLQELQYARATLLQDVEGGQSDELEVLERSIFTHKDLLRQVTSYPNRKLKQPDFLPYDPAPTDMTAALPPPLLPPTSCRSERHLKPIDELCNAYFLLLMREQLAHTERHLRGDTSTLRSAHITRSLSRKLQLTNFLFELWQPDDEEEEEEEALPRATGSQSDEQPLSPESFCSCVEELPIKLETGEEVTPDPQGTMEMTGSVSSSDSIEVIGTERSYRTQRHDASDSEVPVARSSGSEAVPRRVRGYARRANSEDSIEVLSTTESIIPEDLTAITEEEVEPQPLSKGFSEKWEESRNDPKMKPCDDKLVSSDVTVKEALWGRSLAGEGTGSSPSDQILPDLVVNFSTPLHIERWLPPSAPFRPPSAADEAWDSASLAGSSDPPSPHQSVHGKVLSDKRTRRKAGLRALRFLKQNSFSQHAVFCLLSGRPLVVVGGDEGLVRKTVDGLSLFLPAPGAVMKCLSTPLQLSDLLTWRLIGIHRSTSSPSSTMLHSLTRYSRYLGLLDLDQRTLRCPSYSGLLVKTLADRSTNILRGATYLLHLESGLTALANRALLFTFGSEEPDLGKASPSVLGDLSVMRFLSDLIKQHHAGRGPPALRFSYVPLHVHRNTAATSRS
ncbi:guanine nucleotide exchange protein smcr8b [Dunckerocampus dactyliophorus]|uniref:guanine nucleotide exchange protein smcr8b n=1 Tax=Dunckerocampus dactyliophorus TaxID=161453 RepID=UPI002404A126|nr:guanine nucleotide exchange protein smcr8b [Dunckerocampus dactyliophorus]